MFDIQNEVLEWGGKKLSIETGAGDFFIPARKLCLLYTSPSPRDRG